MNNVEVSVIIPCYNIEKYVKTCFESVINQSFQEIEIICINDGSTDNTLKLLETLKKRDDRIVIINKKNCGVSSARNDGIKVAKGKYIMFVDSDDYISVDMIEYMYKKITSEKADIVKCNRIDTYVDRDVKVSRKPIWNDVKIFKKNEFSENVYVEFFGRSRLCNAYMTLIKKSLLDKNGILFSEELIVDEDEIFAMEIFSAAEKFIYLPNPFYYYVKNENGLSGGGTNIYSRIVSRKKHVEYLKKISSNWHIENIETLLREKIAFIGIYTAMQTAAYNTNFSRREQYKLFYNVLNDNLFKESITKSNKSIMLIPEKILCTLTKLHLYHLGFYYSRFVQKLISKYRYKLEKIRLKER